MAAKKIDIVKVIFENELKEYELPAFRAAIANIAGKNNILFHHHKENGDHLYRYPLLQFKIINRRAAIICLEKGANEIHRIFEQKNWNINIGERKMMLEVKTMNMRHFTMNVWDSSHRYHVSNWIGLNAKNYIKWQQTESLTGKVGILEKILTAHILSFAEGIKWDVDKKISLLISKIDKQRQCKYKGVSFMAFDITFTSNVSLPDYIGLGKASSVGFGVVNLVKMETEERFFRNTNDVSWMN